MESRPPIHALASDLTGTLNLGILAHVDAGKTTLTERLLFEAGVIDSLGSVDDGTTQTDTLALERRRGITIRSAVASFRLRTGTVNLIDTPGHPDFIAEVERVLHVLDGAVLVISAVEGVQAQTRVLMRTLQRLRIPTLLFCNKIDRMGSQDDGLLGRIGEHLTPSIVAMGSVERIGTREASFVAAPVGLAEALAEHDEDVLSAYVDGDAIDLRATLAEQTRRGVVHPVFFGSAATGAGVADLSDGIAELLGFRSGDPDAPLSASVFKIERGTSGEKVAYVRVSSGTIATRDPLTPGKVTALQVFDAGPAAPALSARAGHIAKVWGLHDVRVGDRIGEDGSQATHHFAAPTLETVIAPADGGDATALYSALTDLAEQDPLINLRRDTQVYVRLYGEVQKEVIADTLALEYGIEAVFRETTPICIERVVGSGEASEPRGRRNPFPLGLAFRVEPGEPALTLQVEASSVPLYVFKTVDAYADALRETIEATLQQGLAGWEVTNCAVTLTMSDYIAPSTSAHHVRKLAPMVLMEALRDAGTQVCEPVHRFRLEAPQDTLPRVLRLLGRMQAPAQVTGTVLEGELTAARMHELQLQLRSVTRGEGLLEFEFDRYEPVRGQAPRRARTDADPLNRKQYLMAVLRRVPDPAWL